MTQMLQILNRQAKRKDARQKYAELHEPGNYPGIDFEDKEWVDKRKKARADHQAECLGVDADIDWLRESLREAAIEALAHEGVASPSFKQVDDRIDAFLRKSRPHLSVANQETLNKEAERAVEQEAKAKKLKDEEIAAEAERAQTHIPGTEELVKQAKGKKPGAVTTTKTDPFFSQEQIPREDTFIKPEEPKKVETLPPADGQKEDKPSKLTAIKGGKPGATKGNKKK